MSNTRCLCCDEPHDADETFCPSCWPLTDDTAWLVALGRSIGRFARRAEVDALVDTAAWRMDHGATCPVNRPCDCGLSEAMDALDRLAMLALEER